MFLDDELLQMCIDYSGDTPEEVQELNRKLCRKCEEYYKSKITMQTPKNIVKVTINKTFRLWDSFVVNAKKHEDKKVQLLGELFEKFTFKKQWLSHPEMEILYKNL